MGVGPGLSAIRAAAVYLWAGACREVFMGEPIERVIGVLDRMYWPSNATANATDGEWLRITAVLLPASSRSWPPMFAVCVSPRQSSLRSPTIRFSCTALKPSVRVMVATSMAPPTPLVPVVHPWSVAVVLIRKIARSTQSCSGKNW